MRGIARGLVPALLALCGLGLGAAMPATAAAADPWQELAAVRHQLDTSGVQVWDFQQSYVPAGFKSGEQETGHVVLDVPSCVRWDYADPYPKSYLLCGSQLRVWNPGEPVGQRFTLDAAHQPGLDLLLLPVDELRQRYHATAETGQRGARIIHLVPTGEAPLREATLVVAPGGERLQELSYVDREGNRTRFVFTNARPFSGSGIFSPPSGIHWESQEGAPGS